MKNIFTGLFNRVLNRISDLRSRRLVSKAKIVLAGALFFPATMLIAAPQGGTVVQGQGTIAQPTTNSTVISQNTQNLAIDWNSFNVSRNESVTFNQPNSSSVALNRISNASPSEIFGQINANGHVILSNRSGILFGVNAQVNVAGLLATGLDIDPAAFMSGKFDLINNGEAGFVINHGLLNAAVGGSINLVGGIVKNDGVIVADYGQINLLAGESAVVDFSGDGLLNFQLTESVKQNLTGADSAVENAGVLQADGGTVIIEANVAQDIFTQAVNNTGIIRATKIETIGGIVRLSGTGGHVINSGQINAINGGDVVLDSTENTEMTGTGSIDVSNTNGVGGTVSLLGRKVGLFDESSIDVTGKIGGGKVRVGGDIQGGGDLKTADYTVMSGLANIDASATENGNGGSVVLWADKAAQVHGSLKARGGDLGGNGGFIETSGKEFLDVTSIPDAGALLGDAGVWLLDPTDITIVAGADANLDPGLLPGTYSPLVEDVPTTVSAINLQAALALGTSLEIKTKATGTGDGDIFVDTPILVEFINPNINSSLTLTADRNIEFRNGSSIKGTSIEANTSLGVTLSSANGGVILTNAASTAIDTNGGDFTVDALTFDASKTILTNGGNISINAATTVSGVAELSTGIGAGDITLAAVNSATAGADTLNLTAGTGAINLTGDVGSDAEPLDLLEINSGAVVAAVATAIHANTINQVSGSGGYQALTAKAGGITLSGSDFTLGGIVNTTDNGLLTISNSGALNINAALNLDGAFIQNGVGSTTLSSSISTTNDNISFVNPMTVSGVGSLDTGAGDITLVAVNATAADTLNLTAGTGTINLTDTVGDSTNPIGELKINSGAVVAAAAIYANTIDQASGSGSYQVLTATAGGINLTGTGFTLDGIVTTIDGGLLTIGNSGALNINAPLSLSGAFAQSGGGSTILGSSITTTNDDISFINSVTVKVTGSLDTGLGPGDIRLGAVNATTAGADILNLTAGTGIDAGTINLTGDVGSVASPLSTLTINSGAVVSAAATAIHANTINQVSGSGSYAAVTSKAGGINLTGSSFTLNDVVTTSDGGSLIISNSGALNIDAPLNLDGAFSQVGAGSTTLSSSITTSEDDISFANSLNINGVASFNTGAGANITLAAVTAENTDGSDTLSLAAGTEAISLGGEVGSTTNPLGELTLNSSAVTADDAIYANTIKQVGGSGSYRAMTAKAGGINLLGTDISLGGIVTTADGGLLTISNSGALNINAALDLDGAFSQNGVGSTTLSSSISTTNDNISFVNPMTVSGVGSLDTGAGAGDITLVAVNATAADTLNLTAGTGTINLTDTVGDSTNPIGELKVNSGAVVAAAAIYANTIDQVGGSGSYQALTATAGGINLTGTGFTLDGIVTTIDGGLLTIGNSGALNINAPLNLTGAFSQNGAGSTTLSSSITTTEDDISFANSLNINGVASFNTGAGANITLAAVTAENTDGSDTLSLAAGTGVISLGGEVGSTTNPLGELTLNSSAVTADEAIYANTIEQVGGIGNYAVMTAKSGGINLSGSVISLGGIVTTTDGGLLTISNSGALNINAVLDLDGAFSQSGVGSTTLSSSISTTNDNISFVSPMTVSGVGSLDTGAGVGDITLLAVNATATDTLNLTAGTGTINLTDSVGDSGNPIGELKINSGAVVAAAAIHANTINQVSGSGSYQVLSAKAGGINLTGTGFTLDGIVTTTGGGVLIIENSDVLNINAPLNLTGAFSQSGGGNTNLANNITITNDDITFVNPVTLNVMTSLDTGANGGDISLGTVNASATTLNLTAGTGEINFNGDVGSDAEPLDLLKINSGAVVSAAATAVYANTIDQVSGSGSYQTLTAKAGGINLTGSSFTLGDVVTTSAGGSLLISNSGALNIDAPLNLGGAFSQNGGGNTALASSITTTDDDISFANPVTVNLAGSLATGAGDITLAVVNATTAGADTLNLTAGTGAINLTGDVGSVASPLSTLTINSGAVLATGVIHANTINQVSGSGSYAALTAKAGGINLTGSSFTLGDVVATSDGGSLLISNSGALNIDAALNLDGAFSQNGGGNTALASSVTTADDDISFANPVTVNVTGSLDTGAGVGDITLAAVSATTAGVDTLNLTAGTGAINLTGDVGSVVSPLSTLTINSGAVSATGAIHANTINQVGGSGSYQVLTAKAGGINLTGSSFTLGDVVTTSDGGSLLISNSGALNIDAPLNLDGAFSQNGGGNTVLASSIATTGDDISFANPMMVSGTGSLATGTGVGDITLAAVSATTAGADTLNLTAGTGAINLTGDVGSVVSPLSTLTINSGAVSATGTLHANTINQVSGNGSYQALTAKAGGINLTGSSFTLGDIVTTSSGGSLIISNSGALNIDAALNLDGAFSQSGGGNTTLASSITTTNDNISFVNPMVVNGTGSLATGTGAGDISLVAVNATTAVDTLNLTAGTGAINLTGTVGSAASPLNSLTINSGAVSATGAIYANTINQVGGSGSYQALTANTGGINLTGSSFTLGDVVTTSGGGSVTINNTGTLNLNAALNLGGSFNQVGTGSTLLGGNITSAGSEILFTGDLEITAYRILNNTSAGEIKLAGDVVGDYLFELNTGGDIYLAGVDVDTLQLNSGNNLYLSSDLLLDKAINFSTRKEIVLVNDVSISTLESIVFGSTNEISGANALTLTAISDVDLFQVGGGLTNPTSLVVNSASLDLFGTVTVKDEIDFTNTTLTSSAGIEATADNAQVKLGQVNSVNHSLEVINKGVTSLYGDIVAKDVDFSGASGGISLEKNNVRVDTSLKKGDIDFSGININGPGKSLTLAADSGRLFLNNAGVEASPISTLAIESAGAVTLAGSIYTQQTLDFTNVTDITLDPSSLVVGLESTAGSIDLQKTSISGAAGLRLAAFSDVILGGDITADFVDMSGVSAEVVLSKSVTINTSANNGDIEMQNASVVGSNVLTLNAGNGEISLGSVGSNASSINGLKIDNASNLALHGNVFTKNNLDLANAGHVSLLNNIELNTTFDNGAVKFGNTIIDGNHDLLINSGSGLIQLASVGNSTALTELTLNSSDQIQIAGNYNIDGGFNAANASQLNLLNDVEINTSGIDGDVNFSGSNINGGHELAITAGGNVNLGSIGQTMALANLTVAAKEISVASVETSGAQTYTGKLNLAGDLVVTGQGAVDINNDLNLQANVLISAKNNINIIGAIDGSSSLTMLAQNGDVTLRANAGEITALDSLDASGKNISVQSITTTNDIILTAEDSVTQNGKIESTSGDITLTANSGSITMQAGSSTVTSRDNKTLYQANTNLQVTEISGGSVTLDSKTGSISGSFINGTHVDGREVSLLSSSGISAVNESGGVDEFKVVASTLNVTNASNDVLLATQSDTFDANSPESNPLKMGNISVSSGNIAINNVGAIQFVEQVDVEGGVNVASSSQVTIDKKFSAKNDIDIIVAPGDFQFGADGLTLSSSGSIESSQGNINLEINDLVQLLGEVEALGGDITVKSERNAIAVTHINAGSHKATVKAGLSIQALDSNKVHIIADAVELVTGTDGAIGTFAKPVELSTNQTTFNANNYSYMTGNLGIIINSGFGRFLDPGVAISSANKGQSTSAQEFSFVDATVFSPELNLFDRVNEGIRLPEDQLED